MPCQFFPERLACQLLVLGALLATAAPAFAASQTVLPFGPATWQEIASSRLRPLVVVFSATDCVHCPRVIDELAATLRQSRSRARLTVVVMDGAGQEQALLADRYYRHASTLYAFDGNATALRFTVNPDWRGLTPYVALVPASGTARFHSGHPPADALRDFLRP